MTSYEHFPGDSISKENYSVPLKMVGMLSKGVIERNANAIHK